MFKVIENSLFVKDRKSFDQLQVKATEFSAVYCGKNIIQDDIFNIVENYTKHFDLPFELLRYGIDDTELCACTFIRENRVFCLLNASLALSTQIFAAAHELYHIIRYCDEEEMWLRTDGSMLMAEIIDESTAEKEEMEANAFAGLILAPGEQISEQIRIFGLRGKEAELSNVIMLMDIFAIPYKAMVLRLYEEDIIPEESAKKLFLISQEELNDEINVTGRGKRWQIAPTQTEKYGSLLENMKYLEQIDAIRHERLAEDQQILKEILTQENPK